MMTNFYPHLKSGLWLIFHYQKSLQYIKKYKNKMAQCNLFVIEEPSKFFFKNYAFIKDFLY